MIILWKELRYSIRYKIQTINMLVSPFFIIYSYVLLASEYGEGKQILKSMLAWYWLNQIFFETGSGFYVERMEGTFVNYLMCPIGIIKYLFWKYIYIVIICIIISINVIIFGNIFGMNILFKEAIMLVLLLLVSSVPTWTCSLLYCGLCLKYKKMSDINSIVKQILGVLSGCTTNINNYSRIVRFVSYLIPLTYTILMSNKNMILGKYLIPQYGIGIICFGIGIAIIKNSVKEMRQKGECEQW